MEATRSGEIVLIDENVVVGRAMKSYLEKNLSCPVELERSLDERNGREYGMVILNLSYYATYQEIVKSIKNAQRHHFDRLIVMTNLCVKNCPGLNDERITILCKMSFLNKCKTGLEIVADDLPCSEVCSGFESAEPRANEALSEKIEVLSGREKQILKMICKGFSSKEIATKLCISKRTVDFHRENVLRKLNLSRLTQIIGLAVVFPTDFVE